MLAKSLTNMCKERRIRRKISRQAVSKWKHVPHFWVEMVEEMTGISRHDMQPTLFPKR